MSPRASDSNRSITRVRSASPSICRTVVGATGPAACAIAWSNSDSESRTEPSAARAMMPSASGSTSTPSFSAILRKMRHQHVGLDAAQIETLAARQHRDRHFAISVVAKMNLACGGGSSSVFRSALNAAVDSMCTSSMM